MATRKQAREAVIQILYARELGNEQAIEQAHFFLNEQKIRNKQQEFALALLHGVCVHEDYIIQIMNTFLKTWDIERLGVIEKNILKLGIYELLQTNTQQAIIINEAIELTKSFSVQDAFRLVNGVLDSVAKTDKEALALLVEQHKQMQIESQATKTNSIQSTCKQNSIQKTRTCRNHKTIANARKHNNHAKQTKSSYQVIHTTTKGNAKQNPKHITKSNVIEKQTTDSKDIQKPLKNTKIHKKLQNNNIKQQTTKHLQSKDTKKTIKLKPKHNTSKTQRKKD